MANIEVTNQTFAVDFQQSTPDLGVEFLLPLSQSIDVARSSMQRAIQAHEVWTLPKTGFTVDLQFEELLETLEPNADNLVVSEVRKRVNAWGNKAAENMLGFYIEYLSDRVVYPINTVLTKDGLVCPKYDNKRLVDTVSANERNGAVLHAVHTVDSFMKNAENNSFAFYTSPPGWSNTVTLEGKPITYTSSQTYMFWKDLQGKVIACTVQSNMGLVENEKLLRSFGYIFPPYYYEFTSEEKLQYITAQVVAGKAGEKNPFTNIARIISDYTGSEIIGKRASLSSVLHQIDGILQGNINSAVPEEILQIIGEFKKMTEGIDPTDPLILYAQAVGNAVLELAVGTQQDEASKLVGSGQDDNGYYLQFNRPVGYVQNQNPLEYLQTKAGCNGGGESASYNIISNGIVMQTPFGIRIGLSETPQKQEKWHIGDCRIPKPQCGRTSVEVGECNICKVCQKKFDSGEYK